MLHIFKDIVETMHKDYAGCMDKQGCDRPELFTERLQHLQEKGELTNEAFIAIVKEYLLDFNDRHISFSHPDTKQNSLSYCGFQVRRYEDKLYVTKADAEQRLKVGDVFTGIGGLSIPELKAKHASLLNESHPERESWTSIFSYYEFAELEGSVEEPFQLQFYKGVTYVPTYSICKLDDATICLTMTDFMNPDAIVSLLNEHKDLLMEAENWVMDVRINYGGSDMSFFPLLPYIAPSEGMDSSTGDKMYFLCTEANTERRVAEFEEMLQQIDDEESKKAVRIFLRETVKNNGKGFAEFDFSELLTDTFIKGNAHPKRVIVLSDTFCGSSGDSFVEICRKSPKVTVLGRASMGLNDYANVAAQTWDSGFVLNYPTSRLSRIDEGNGMTGVGILPHIHIPWTPAHLHKDVDMEYAMDLLNKAEC